MKPALYYRDRLMSNFLLGLNMSLVKVSFIAVNDMKERVRINRLDLRLSYPST